MPLPLYQSMGKLECCQSFCVDKLVNSGRPYPYHPYGSVRSHGEVADSEGQRLQKLFEDSF
jgi:hypothetical protein